ncbi:MAG: EF-P beta-lysylation protein EpmB [Planctomycetaceae bacterium]
MSPVPTANSLRTDGEGSVSAVDDGRSETWQRQLAGAVRSWRELLRILQIQERDLPPIAQSHTTEAFPVLVPHSFLQRMETGNPRDPLLLQVLPVNAEDQAVAGFTSDPVSDEAARKAPGLLQKYHGRALLITTGTCAVHCRYCFRREYPYHEEPRRPDDWQPAIDCVAGDDSISEVILSGGDPLMLSDRRLEDLLRRLDAIPHLTRIRIHSRLPIVLPARITSSLLALLTGLRCQVIMVVHANHGHEIQKDCVEALTALVRSGLPVLNQAVLLKDVNDDPQVLETLCLKLVGLGVIPYYLHQLDRVQGASHFEVSEARGRQLIRMLADRLPGYAVPRYVREVPGRAGKTRIAE